MIGIISIGDLVKDIIAKQQFVIGQQMKNIFGQRIWGSPTQTKITVPQRIQKSL